MTAPPAAVINRRREREPEDQGDRLRDSPLGGGYLYGIAGEGSQSSFKQRLWGKFATCRAAAASCKLAPRGSDVPWMKLRCSLWGPAPGRPPSPPCERVCAPGAPISLP